MVLHNPATKQKPVTVRFANALGLQFEESAPEERGALALLWAGLLLADRANEPTYCMPILVEFARVLAPHIKETRIRRLLHRLEDDVRPISTLCEGEAVRQAFPGELLVAGLVQLVPPGHPDQSPSWHLIDTIASTIGVDLEVVTLIDSWRLQSADSQLNDRVNEFLTKWANLNSVCYQVATLLTPIKLEEKGVDFLELRESVGAALRNIEPLLDELHIPQTERSELRDYLANDRFRLAVMGEFNRGKSTLINALLERPSLMPTATLPCTSGLTEIRAGEETSYSVSYERGYPGTYQESTEEDFRGEVAQAASQRHSQDEAEEVAERVLHWRVTLPSGFLEETAMSLVDSPGLGEDYARDEISKLEAKRADAAILIFDAQQLASLDELELISEMNTKAQDLFIVINKADQIDDSERPELRRHVLNRIGNVTSVPFDERVVFLSAKQAEAALRDLEGSGRSSGNSANGAVASAPTPVQEFRDFRQVLRNRLLQRIGHIKAKTLRLKVNSLIDATHSAINHELETRRSLLKSYTELKVARVKAEEHFKSAKQSIEFGTQSLNKPTKASKALQRAFEEEVPNFIEELRNRSNEWNSERNAMFSPKKYATDIAKHAQRDLTQLIETWLNTRGADVVVEEIDKQLEETIDQLEPLEHYLRDAAGLDLSDFKSRMRQRALERAFGQHDLMSTQSLVGGTAVVSALSAALGYIIADVVLYYILSLISGFLNPVLLAAAAVAAIPVSIVGQGPLKKWVKNKIITTIKDELQSGQAKTKIEEGLEEAVGKVFEQLSRGFQESAQSLLFETRAQLDRTVNQLEDFKEKMGNSPQAREEELERVETLAEQASEQLTKLGALVDLEVTQQ